MWIFTKIGFFSIVQKPWDKDTATLTVRARVKADLEAFKKLLKTRAAYKLPVKIVVDDDADYRFRLQAPAPSVQTVVAALAYEIDYDNFKNQVAKVQGNRRAAVYGTVWEDLLSLQTLPPD